MSAPLVIIGAGQAAAQAVTSLKAEGYGKPIIVIGDEPYLPYQRPPLSKAYLGGEMTEDRLELKGARGSGVTSSIPMPFRNSLGLSIMCLARAGS